jgi:hypothetical protein
MKGDYHRYLAEFKTSSDRKEAAEHTLLAYKAAQVRGAGLCSSFLRQLPLVVASLTSGCSRRTSPWWTWRQRTLSGWVSP